MKKILLYIGMTAMLLSACSKDEQSIEKGQNPDGTFTFNLALDVPDEEKADGAAAKVTTKATVTMARYLLEMYEGNLDATPVKMSNNTGIFNVKMKEDVDYICLFWADGGEADYTATDLKAVTQTTPTDLGKPAYYAKVTVNTTDFDGSVKLTRAVAEVQYIETDGFLEGNNALTVTYPITGTAFNVADGTVANFGTGTEITRTFSAIAAKNANDTIATDYLLAPATQTAMSNIKFQFNTEPEKTLLTTPLQANFKTNVKGKYSSTPIVCVSNENEFLAEWTKAEESGGDFIVMLKNDITLSDNEYSDELLEGKIIVHGNYTLTIDVGITIFKSIVFNCKVAATDYGALIIQSGGSYTPKSADDFACPVAWYVTTDAEFLHAMNNPNTVGIYVVGSITLTSTGDLSNTDAILAIDKNFSLTIPTTTTLSVGALGIWGGSTLTGGTINVAGEAEFGRLCTIAAGTTINCTTYTTDGNTSNIYNNGTITYSQDVDHSFPELFIPNQPTKRP